MKSESSGSGASPLDLLKNFEAFLDKIRNAAHQEIKTLLPDIEKILLQISQTSCSAPEKNELIRKIAFSLFNRPEIDSFEKKSTILATLRTLIFHSFERIDITAKFFMYACKQYFLKDKQEESIATRLYGNFWELFHGMWPMKEAYVPKTISSKLSEKITTVYMGVGRDFFNLLSEGKIKGYELPGNFTGIFVSPIDTSMGESERLRRTAFYADRSSTPSFDYPVYIEMNVPSEHLNHTWMRNANHANRYEAVLTKEDLAKIRENQTVQVTMFPYKTFTVSTESRHEWAIREEYQVTPEQLQLSEDDYNLAKQFVIENFDEKIRLPERLSQTSRHFTFGESVEETKKETQLSKQNRRYY